MKLEHLRCSSARVDENEPIRSRYATRKSIPVMTEQPTVS